jgi:hypothetical protein
MNNMKHKILMTLALLLTAVTGAWAQSSLNVVELEVPAAWENDESLVTAADLPGFKASTKEEAEKWTGAPESGVAMLIYAFNGEDVCFVAFENGVFNNESQTTIMKDGIFGLKSEYKFYYTAEITEWSLTPDETGKTWTLAKMPASNVELQVEYFAESNLFLSKDALADKTNIAVTAGETAVDFGDDGKSANTVTEGTPMTVKFTGKKVLGMKVEKKSEAGIVNPAVGQIIGSDGKNYDANATLPDGVTAVAKVCYVDGNGHGLAMAQADEGQLDWTTAQSTCAAHTPAITGGTWKLATKDEWQQMIDAVGGFNNLKNGFSSVGGTNLQSQGYWTNTEYESDDQMAYVYYFNSNMLNKAWKTTSTLQVRACLAF